MKDELLIKYLTGNCSEAETVEVEKWLRLAPDNTHRLEELRQLWSLTAVNTNIDTDLAWTRLRQRIEVSDSGKSGVLRRLSTSPIFYFASAAAIILAVFFITRKSQPSIQEFIATGYAPASQSLSDGSLVSLKQGSKLSYPKSFAESERMVKLEGEAYFDVEKDSSRPFVVHTRKAEVRVLGTAFNIREETDSLVLSVTEGLVAISSLAHADEAQTISAGEEGVLIYRSGEIRRRVKTVPDALFWYNNSLTFEATPLPEVLEMLEKYYEINFSYDNKSIEDCLLTTRFEGEELGDILLVIESTFGLKFQSSHNQFEVISNDNPCKDSI